MTKTATITGPITDAALTAQVNTPVTVQIVTGSATLATFATGTVVAGVTVITDGAGQPKTPLVLPLNSEAQQPGTYYQATAGTATWAFRLDAVDDGASIQWGDLAHTVTSPTPADWVPIKGDPGDPGTQGAQGVPAAVAPSVLASRPAAGAVPDGALHFATDLDGGQVAVSDGSSWQDAAPSLASVSGGRHLGGVQLTVPQSNAGVGSNADVTGMTVTFTSTGGVVLVCCSALLATLRRATWTPVAGTFVAPGVILMVDGAIAVGMAVPAVDASLLSTTVAMNVSTSLVWPVALSAGVHTIKWALPAQTTQVTWSVSPGFPTFGTPGSRLDVVQLS